MGFAILYAARMFWWVCQLYSANHCCSQLIPGMFWTKQHGLHSCAPACVSQCAADEPRDVFTSLIRRARTKIALIAQQPVLFSSEPDFLGISLTEVSSFTVASYLSEPAEYRRYFLAFCRRAFEREAPKKLCLFCRLPPLQTTDTTRKRQDSEGFELGTVSRHLTRWNSACNWKLRFVLSSRVDACDHSRRCSLWLA